MCAVLQELGGTLILNNGVKKISLAEGKVTGVILESGTDLPADAVVAAIHPKILLKLLDENALRDSYRRRILGLKETEGVIAVNVSVDAAAHPEINHNIYRLHRDENGIIQDGVFYQLRGGKFSGSNLLSIITKSLYSDWSQWENTTSGKRGKDYEEKKMSIAKSLLKKAEEIFGRSERRPNTRCLYSSHHQGLCKCSRRRLLRSNALVASVAQSNFFK